MYTSLQEQVAQQSTCTVCEGTLRTQLLGACRPKEELDTLGKKDVDILLSGSPCDPFSMQRSKRFGDDSVKTHYQFEVSMKQVIDLYIVYEPLKMVFEQVMGFTMPFEKGGQSTPKEMFPVLTGKLANQHVFFVFQTWRVIK